MATKCTIMLLCGGMLVNMAPAARLAVNQMPSQSDKVKNQTRACFWGREHCCCEIAGYDVDTISCKKFVTGMIDGQEACSCGDAVVQHVLKMPYGHQPSSWKDRLAFYHPKLYARSLSIVGVKGLDLEPFHTKMESMCAPRNNGGGGDGTTDIVAAVEIVGEQPAGSCTDERLFELARKVSGEDKLECIDYLAKSTSRNRDRLEPSKLMKTFDERMTASSLMGCAKIGLGCNRGSLQSRAIVTAIAQVKSNPLYMGDTIQHVIMTKAREMLQIESGLPTETAEELLNWAFYHEEGQNPYCDENTLGERRDMLVRGLTAADADHEVKDLPWKYGEEVYGPIKNLLKGTIDGMFAADCAKPEPFATAAEANEGKGIPMSLTEDQLQKMTAKKDAAVAESDYLRAHEIKEEIVSLTAGNRLAEFAKISPMIETTLKYLERPVLQHQIEQNEADFVRLCMNTLADLLKNEKFMKHLRRFGGFDNWVMPPELDGLWEKTRKAKYFERIWPDSLLNEFQNKSTAHPSCDCKDISPALGLHFLNMLPKIGLDFGNVRRSELDGKLYSDKETDTLEHVDLAGFAETMIMVEAGIADPVFAVKYITKVLLAYGEKGGSASGLPDVGASGKIKGVLVGMPIMQNLWQALNENTSPEVFAKKMKWFFVANIAWAVWHAIETPLPPEDIVLGLLTLAYATLSSFAYDGEFLVFSNSKEFTDQMLAVYTVWNYRFVQQWASSGKAQDQWMHVSVALSMPIIESLVNHGDIRHYINYRRDDLFHSMLLMLKNM
mmetsp:Transcript_73262/g.115938  ORF Transcript_73262/g.115938 Transcript_73262/m.115938 type:complete len:779 (-) Transcript_73262:110-2446(-)